MLGREVEEVADADGVVVHVVTCHATLHAAAAADVDDDDDDDDDNVHHDDLSSPIHICKSFDIFFRQRWDTSCRRKCYPVTNTENNVNVTWCSIGGLVGYVGVDRNKHKPIVKI